MLRFKENWSGIFQDYPIASHRATGASLEISIQNSSVSRHFDFPERSEKKYLTVPLYPLAEWLCQNWFFLFYETETQDSADFAQRHSLSTVGDGFAWPDLWILPEGDSILLEWKAYSHEYAKVSFLQSGSTRIKAEGLKKELETFLDRIDQRLTENSITNTAFQEDWRFVKNMEEEVAQFYQACAALGKTPEELNEGESQQILDAAQVLPRSLHRSFFEVAQEIQLSKTAQRIAKTLKVLESQTSSLNQLDDIQLHFQQLPSHPCEPWAEGYASAQKLRSLLGMDAKEKIDMGALMPMLGMEYSGFHPFESLNLNGASAYFEALTGKNKSNQPVFALKVYSGDHLAREASQQFVFCRALYELLQPNRQANQLITSSRSASQKKNRAFAAEFLAPASALKSRLAGRKKIYPEEIENLAAEFGVSSFILKHQVENHHLAHVIDEAF